MAILTMVRWFLSVVLICIDLIISHVNYVSMCFFFFRWARPITLFSKGTFIPWLHVLFDPIQWEYSLPVEIGFLNDDPILNSFFGDLPQGLHLRAGVLSSPACLVNIQNRFSSVQLLSHVWLTATPMTAARQPCLSITISQSLLKLMSIKLVMPSNYLILCHPLLLLPSVFPSLRVFSNGLAFWLRWPNCWNFSFSPSNEYSGLISFRIDWLDPLAVQGTLKNLFQHHTSKASIL